MRRFGSPQKRGADGKVHLDASGAIHVWFNGSNSMWDWVLNFLCLTNRRDRKEAESIINRLMPFIEDYRTFHVYGVSLGGAFAVWFSLILILRYRKRVTLRLYVAKRTIRGIDLVLLMFRLAHFRHIAISGDLVPKLPTWYSDTVTSWISPKVRPFWRAHKKVIQRAARKRHEIGKL